LQRARCCRAGGHPFGGSANLNLSALTGIEFEDVIAEALRRMGLVVETTKASGDGGIDIIAVLDKAFIGGRFLVQCKRYAEDTVIGAPAVREFYGAFKADRKAHKAIMVTTARFSTQAEQFAEEVGIELIDGERLQNLLTTG
jgi:restriction system protein